MRQLKLWGTLQGTTTSMINPPAPSWPSSRSEEPELQVHVHSDKMLPRWHTLTVTTVLLIQEQTTSLAVHTTSWGGRRRRWWRRPTSPSGTGGTPTWAEWGSGLNHPSICLYWTRTWMFVNELVELTTVCFYDLIILLTEGFKNLSHSD